MAQSDPRTELLLTLAGVVAIFALIFFFALELTNPQSHVLPDRTIYVMLSIIAALLGFKSLAPHDRQTDGGRPLKDTTDEPDETTHGLSEEMDMEGDR